MERLLHEYRPRKEERRIAELIRVQAEMPVAAEFRVALMRVSQGYRVEAILMQHAVVAEVVRFSLVHAAAIEIQVLRLCEAMEILAVIRKVVFKADLHKILLPAGDRYKVAVQEDLVVKSTEV